mgnify:CR=1 FL=1
MLIAFYILSLLAVMGALSLVLVRSPIYCALALVGSLISVSGIYILLNNEFVAAIQILIYAGAIMVLFLFVIMLLNLRSDEDYILRWTTSKVIGLAVILGILAQFVAVFFSSASKTGPMGDYGPEQLAGDGAVGVIGDLLFVDYVLPFEVISVLLLVAIMGAVLLAKRHPGEGEEK